MTPTVAQYCKVTVAAMDSQQVDRKVLVACQQLPLSEDAAALYFTLLNPPQEEYLCTLVLKPLPLCACAVYNEDDPSETLWYAVLNDHKAQVELAIAEGADLEVKLGHHHDTPLTLAAKNGYLDVVETLIAAGADVDSTRDDGATPLCAAAEKNHAGVVLALLRADAKVDKPKTSGITPLLAASRSGYVEVVQSLIRAGADVNLEQNTGTTPLMAASWEGHADVVSVLLDAGADPNKDSYCPPIVCAATYAHLEAVVVLLDSEGLDVDGRRDHDGATALIAATHSTSPRRAAVVAALIVKGADLELKSRTNGTTALYEAAQRGHLDVVMELIGGRADLNEEKAGSLETPLFAATAGGHVDVVRALLVAGAGPDIRSHEGLTPLIVAARRGDSDVVETLLEGGADPIKWDERGMAPLHRASNTIGPDSERIVLLLVRRGGNVNAVDNEGNTPLMFAAYFGNLGAARILVGEGAGVGAQNGVGGTAVDLICDCRLDVDRLDAPQCPAGGCDVEGTESRIRTLLLAD
ncbi:unnamed protein product [Ostreobium quekettii]|uniref:Ankyrin repeat protein n=1 Tax=Ostreobium quekettii TaxID=121088 RepID=A0A8S1IUM3_9CHLO|nr:unnamed protein product [Ostreobium quekettii]